MPSCNPELEDAMPNTIHPDAPVEVTLTDGSLARVYPRVPVTVDDRRSAALQAAIYFFGGHVDHVGGYLGGYLGQSQNLYGGRAAESLTRWVLDQRRIRPTGMVLIAPARPYRDGYQRVIEAAAIMTLSARGLHLLNSQSAAPCAARTLSTRERTAAQAVAVQIADVIHEHVFHCATNAYPSPTGNTREAAVRVVLHAARALDTDEVVNELRRTGVASTGATWSFTVRRDLHLREKHAGGTPRVATAQHRGRRLYWNPILLTPAAALAGYDYEHPDVRGRARSPRGPVLTGG
jgi:hypothetical protein